MVYRPWGILDWILSRGPDITWDLIGCFGTEERSLSVWHQLHGRKRLSNIKLLRINDKPSRYSALATERLDVQVDRFERSGGDIRFIENHEITESQGDIFEAFRDFIKTEAQSVIVDVTSLPKRFFFPIIKILMKMKTTENLMVTYTRPESYTAEKLAENFDDWAHLPMFLGGYDREPAQMLIVNVGFAPMGLKRELGQGEPGLPIKLLFPFPAPLRAVQRAWGFVQNLQKGRSPDSFTLYRTDAKDVSGAFDRLVSLTDGGSLKAELAPFGPKPISVAMCIFAVLTQSEVFYTQPTVYHPDYSTGISQINGIPETYAYWVRLRNKDFYSI